MKLVRKVFARIWRDFFYVIFPGKLSVWIALNCRQTVQEMNTSQNGSFRMKLHLTLCSACRNYSRYGEWLKLNLANEKPDLSKLNGKLLKKFSEPE